MNIEGYNSAEPSKPNNGIDCKHELTAAGTVVVRMRIESLLVAQFRPNREQITETVSYSRSPARVLSLETGSLALDVIEKI